MACKATDNSQTVEGDEGDSNITIDTQFNLSVMSEVHHIASSASSENEEAIRSDNIIPKSLMHPRAESTRIDRVDGIRDSGRGSSIPIQSTTIQPPMDLTCQKGGEILHHQTDGTDTSPNVHNLPVTVLDTESILNMFHSLTSSIQTIQNSLDKINKSFELEAQSIRKDIHTLTHQHTSLESTVNIVHDEQKKLREHVHNVELEFKETKHDLTQKIDSQNVTINNHQTQLEEKVLDLVVTNLQEGFKESRTIINKLEEKYEGNFQKLEINDHRLSDLSSAVKTLKDEMGEAHKAVENIQAQDLVTIRKHIQENSQDISVIHENLGAIRKQVANPTCQEIRTVVHTEITNPLSHLQFHGSLGECIPAFIQQAIWKQDNFCEETNFGNGRRNTVQSDSLVQGQMKWGRYDLSSRVWDAGGNL